MLRDEDLLERQLIVKEVGKLSMLLVADMTQ